MAKNADTTIDLTTLITDEVRKNLDDDAAHARRGERLGNLNAPFWQDVVRATGDGSGKNGPKRSKIVHAVLAQAGLAKDEPITVSGQRGVRTPYGAVVNRMSERYDAARRVVLGKSDETDKTDDKPAVLRATLSGKGGGSVTIPADHPLHDQIVALIAEGK